MTNQHTSVLLVATSYPRSKGDWQGIFIQRLVNAMALDTTLGVELWTPPGPIPPRFDHASTMADRRFLLRLANAGGPAYRLRTRPFAGVLEASQLMIRLGALYRRDKSDVLHINWLQNALPLHRLERRAVITVLGTDFRLLRVPGMTRALRQVFKSNRCTLAPNAPWMAHTLEKSFGDLCTVSPTNFGIDKDWFDLPQPSEVGDTRRWLMVTRVTRPKLGHLLDWGSSVFSREHPLDLIGPMQEPIKLPDWIRHHGHASPEDLRKDWFPSARGLISLSTHSEGRPQVMLEAMAAGLPVIASALPAHTSTVQGERTGFLVQSREEFEKAMARLADESVRSFMGRAAREVAETEFGTWEDAKDRYKRLYEALMAE